MGIDCRVWYREDDPHVVQTEVPQRRGRDRSDVSRVMDDIDRRNVEWATTEKISEKTTLRDVKGSSLNGLSWGVVLMTVTVAIVRPLLGFVGSVTVDATRRVRAGAEMSKRRVTISPRRLLRGWTIWLVRFWALGASWSRHRVRWRYWTRHRARRCQTRKRVLVWHTSEASAVAIRVCLLRRWIGRRTVVGARGVMWRRFERFANDGRTCWTRATWTVIARSGRARSRTR